MRRRRAAGAAGFVRIIGGRYRGRRLPVADVEGLRPTPDRLRETLFNWLAPRLRGVRCLDLFAGTGALGLEAASRGADEVFLVERDPRCVSVLRASIDVLAAPGVRLVQADALHWLAGQHGPFEVVFLDPPYAGDLLALALSSLAAGKLLADEAWVYAEQRAGASLPELPVGWSVHRESAAGQAVGRLLRATRAG